jgi:hypothetical protein
MDVMFQVSRGRSRSHGNCVHVVVGRPANTIDICIRVDPVGCWLAHAICDIDIF